MSSSSDSIFGITTAIVAIPPGATQATLVNAGGGGGYVRATLVKWASGGSLSVFGFIQGTTNMVGTSMVAGYSNSYLLATTEILSIGGPTQFYLAATGSTAVANILCGLSSNFPSLT